MDKRVVIYLPPWATVIYGIMAVALIPWIFSLAQNLPSRHLTNHWATVWVGFDMIMLLTLLITLWFMIKRRVWVIVSASALAMLFIIDVWFDVMTAKSGHEQHVAIAFGVLELLLAILTFRFVYFVVRHAVPEKHMRLAASKKHKI